MEDQTEIEEREPEEVNWPGCGLYTGWMAASIVGMGLGWGFGWLVSFRVPGFLATPSIGLVTGTILGIFQWLVLRGVLSRPGLWILTTIIGWAAGFTIGSLAFYSLGLGEAWLGPVIGLFVGGLLGVLQWRVLRREIDKSGWWVLASLVGWTSSLIYYRPGFSWSGLLYGTLSGIVTGLALVWLLNRPVE